jgi:hypothetical protein
MGRSARTSTSGWTLTPWSATAKTMAPLSYRVSPGAELCRSSIRHPRQQVIDKIDAMAACPRASWCVGVPQGYCDAAGHELNPRLSLTMPSTTGEAVPPATACNGLPWGDG